MAHSEETKKKISEKLKGRIAWNKGIKSKEAGSHWYNNGIENKRFFDTDIIPEGYIQGFIENYPEASRKIQAEKTKQTKLERYGDENYNNIDKNKKTKLERYGDENYNNRELAEQTCIKKYGVLNISQVPEIRSKVNNTMLNKYGYINNFQNPEILLTAIQHSTTPEKIKQREDTLEKRTGYKHPNQNPKTMSKVTSTAKHSTAFDGTIFDSSWEVIIYEYAINHNLEIMRNIPIHYNYNNKNKITYIDFKIDNFLIEVKGGHLFEDVFGNNSSNTPFSIKLNLYKTNNINIITNITETALQSGANILDIEWFKENRDWEFIKSKLIMA